MSNFTNWNGCYTNAPEDYDYGWTEEIRRYESEGEGPFGEGETVRLIKLPTDSVRRDSQVKRYRSGLYRVQRARL